jgi:asparagine synthase (glutamine-hydrolysing)
LVDAKLQDVLGPFVSRFAGGAGKAMLAQSPKIPLPDTIANRPKTGFSLPMATWLSKAMRMRAAADLPLRAEPRTPWARRWARSVLAGIT